jgi:uncharacterized protein
MNFFHLSHTDMDGYGCQLISKKIFPKGSFFNANYGIEVKIYLEEIIEEIGQLCENSEVFFLITDLNLSTEQSKKLNNDINTLREKGYKIKMQLLDHHGTGSKSAKRYEWYYLDTSRCATKITYDYFIKNYSNFLSLCEENFDLLIQAINAADIWLEDDPLFEYGKVCMSMVSRAREINNTLFAKKHREYTFFLLNKALLHITNTNGYIELDEKVYHYKKEFLNHNGDNDSLDNLSSNYLVESLDSMKEQLTVYYKEHKGLLTYALGSISIPANAFLKANKDYDFFIDIGKRGKASFRADNKIDVSLLAAKLANGGGHPNASGASFEDFKETVLYEDVKKFIQEKLDACE